MMLAEDCKAVFRELGGIVIIPTYNNSGTICDVIRSVLEYSYDVMVVNDGCTDHTSELLTQFDNLKILSYDKNRGKGYALRLALNHARKEGYRYAITIDADGQHYADDIPVFVERIQQVPDSLLIGARNLRADNMPSKNTFANKFSNFWYRVETLHVLQDTQSGYRLYPLRKLDNIFFVTRRYEFEVEIIVRAAWRGVNVENIPVKVYYPPVEERVSHFRPLRDFTRISILNTFLVIIALLYYYPKKFLGLLSKENVIKFIDTQIIHSKESNLRLSLAMGWGVFCGIIPIWGYQMIFAAVMAHFMKLNKVITLVFSNISIPPLIPFIIYFSLKTGAFVMGSDINISLSDLTIEKALLSFYQYIWGSILFAFIMGIFVSISGYTLMVLFKRNS